MQRYWLGLVQQADSKGGGGNDAYLAIAAHFGPQLQGHPLSICQVVDKAVLLLAEKLQESCCGVGYQGVQGHLHSGIAIANVFRIEQGLFSFLDLVVRGPAMSFGCLHVLGSSKVNIEVQHQGFVVTFALFLWVEVAKNCQYG